MSEGVTGNRKKKRERGSVCVVGKKGGAGGTTCCRAIRRVDFLWITSDFGQFRTCVVT